MYTVIGTPRSRAMRVIYALEELELPYEIDPQWPHSEKLRTINSTGKIPALITPEGTLTDSVAIVTYLADKHGGLTHPAGTFARGVQDGFTQHIVAEIDAALWTYSKHTFVLPEKLRVEAVTATAVKEYTRALAQIEKQKGDRPFLAGDFFTIPDLLLCHCVGWALMKKIPVPDNAFGTYLKSLRKRPAIARALEKSSAYSSPFT